MTTQEKRLAALEIANDRRFTRSRWRRNVTGLAWPEAFEEISVVLRARPEWLATTPVGQVLRWSRGMGVSRVSCVLRKAGVDGDVPVGRLTDRQVDVVLNEYAAGCTGKGAYGRSALNARVGVGS